MLATNTLSILFATLISSSFFTVGVTAANHRGSAARAVAETRYSKAHSLGNGYQFDPRDGWQTVNASDLQYKYRRDENSATGNSTNTHAIQDRSAKKASKKTSLKKADSKGGIGGTIKGAVKNVLKGLKGIGKSENVTITWYTGHDLLNPSCWSGSSWAPTDASFGCAITLDGWTDRPKCFKFLEVCNTPKKCVFVRVIDTCAGCAKGSKHVDLTRAAFGELADFDDGILSVQMRPATEPTGWYENLWGPKV